MKSSVASSGMIWDQYHNDSGKLDSIRCYRPLAIPLVGVSYVYMAGGHAIAVLPLTYAHS
jgi:hypothetical protein